MLMSAEMRKHSSDQYVESSMGRPATETAQ